MFGRIVTKALKVPSGESTLEAVELHEVRWQSRYGSYNGETKPEVEVFTSKKAAEAFAEALKAAFKLVKHTSGTKVEVAKRT